MGAGMEGGVHCTCTRKEYSRMGRELDYAGQSILLNTISTGYWTDDRLFNAGYEASAAGVCARCGEDKETPYH
eukprot:6722499-Pyramimonas_sp.AAC.1